MYNHLRSIRWIALGGGLVVCLWACISHPLTQPVPDLGQETRAEVTIVPMRHLDLIFMIDNSGSMKPKQDKMRAQFPRLIEALRDRGDGSLPDLRIAILDSDLGGGSGDCGTKTGPEGDKGVFQMRNAAACGANEGARWLEFTKGKGINFKGDDVSEVFGCLASAVGVEGCGWEHQLGAFQRAFYFSDNISQWDFIRPEAYLGIVLLTDEDDCSAPRDTEMFKKRLLPESGSLRCATRGHQCANTQLGFPMTGPVSVPYSACQARTDESCKDSAITADATSCNPLTSIADLVWAVKRLKAGGDTAEDIIKAEEMILVAGIYGRQRSSDTTTPVYKIDLVKDPSRPDKDDAKVLDYWPICFDPDYPPSTSGYDKTAFDHGATGGLRIDAFLNEFPASNRRAYSICESDFGPAMQGIGDALANLMGNLCVPFKLVDRSPDPGLQADCRVAYKIPHDNKTDDGKWIRTWDEDAQSLHHCDGDHKTDCWQVVLGNANGSDIEKAAAKLCPAKGSAPSQMVNVVRKPNDDLPVGTKAVMQCLSCVDADLGSPARVGCDY